MTIELWSLLATVGVLWAVIFTQQIHMDRTAGTAYALSNREEHQPNATALTGRLARTVRNHIEGLAVFAPLVLIATVAQISNPFTQYTAMSIAALRGFHAIFYINGVTPFRSVTWGLGFLAATPAFVYGVLSG